MKINTLLRAVIVLLTLTVIVSAAISNTKSQELCKKRGHVLSERRTKTPMPPYTYFVDLPDKTLRIYCNYNIETYLCMRCGEMILIEGKCDTTVVWKEVILDPVYITPDSVFIDSLKVKRIFYIPIREKRYIPLYDTTLYRIFHEKMIRPIHDTTLYDINYIPRN